jgi:uncharacterized protein Veg
MESSKPKNKSHVINFGEDEASQGAFVDLERPIGRKAEKEKRKTKEKTNPSVVAILNDMNEDKKKKIKLFEEAREQDKEMLILKQEEVRLKQEELRLQEKKKERFAGNVNYDSSTLIHVHSPFLKFKIALIDVHRSVNKLNTFINKIF